MISIVFEGEGGGGRGKNSGISMTSFFGHVLICPKRDLAITPDRVLIRSNRQWVMWFRESLPRGLFAVKFARGDEIKGIGAAVAPMTRQALKAGIFFFAGDYDLRFRLAAILACSSRVPHLPLSPPPPPSSSTCFHFQRNNHDHDHS